MGVDLDSKQAGVERADVMETKDRILGTIEPSGYGRDHGGDKEDPKRAHPDRA